MLKVWYWAMKFIETVFLLQIIRYDIISLNLIKGIVIKFILKLHNKIIGYTIGTIMECV